MNKVILSVLVAGVSFGGIQGASAMEDPSMEESGVSFSRIPEASALEDVKDPWMEGYVPSAPAKGGMKVYLQRVSDNPDKFRIYNDILWERNDIKKKREVEKFKSTKKKKLLSNYTSKPLIF